MRWRKSGAEGAQIGTSLPKRHPSRAAQLLKKPGKIGRTAEKIGCRIGKLSVRENRRLSLPWLENPARRRHRRVAPSHDVVLRYVSCTTAIAIVAELLVLEPGAAAHRQAKADVAPLNLAAPERDAARRNDPAPPQSGARSGQRDGR